MQEGNTTKWLNIQICVTGNEGSYFGFVAFFDQIPKLEAGSGSVRQGRGKHKERTNRQTNVVSDPAVQSQAEVTFTAHPRQNRSEAQTSKEQLNKQRRKRPITVLLHDNRRRERAGFDRPLPLKGFRLSVNAAAATASDVCWVSLDSNKPLTCM